MTAHALLAAIFNKEDRHNAFHIPTNGCALALCDPISVGAQIRVRMRRRRRRRRRVGVRNLNADPHRFAKILLRTVAHLPEALKRAVDLGRAQGDIEVNHLAGGNRAPNRRRLAVHRCLNSVAVDVDNGKVSLPRACAAVTHAPSLGEVLAWGHDGRRRHVLVVQVQVADEGHAFDAGFRRGRRHGIGDYWIFDIGSILVGGHFLRFVAQVESDKLGKCAVALHGNQRRVELRHKRRSPGCSDCILLLIELLAHEDEVVGILQCLVGCQLAQQHNVKLIAAHVDNGRADGGIGNKILLADDAGIHQVLLRPRLEGGAALHAYSQARKVGSCTQRSGECIACHCDRLADVVEVGKVNKLLAVRRHRNGSDGGIHVAQLHGVEQAVKGVVAEAHFEAKLFAQCLGQGDVETVQLKF